MNLQDEDIVYSMIERHGGNASQPTTTRRTSIATLIWLQNAIRFLGSRFYHYELSSVYLKRGNIRMNCAFCKENNKLTKEHIIPESLINLFPECDYTYRRGKETKTFQAHPMIKDVCAVCNNEALSILDQYGLSMIEKYFYTNYVPDSEVEVVYSYNLLSRFLMKLCFNSDRSFKQNQEWFENNLSYILGKKDFTNYSFSVYAGLAINTSPLPNFFFENKQLEIVRGVRLLPQGMLRYADGMGHSVEIVKDIGEFDVPSIHDVYALRLGASQFLLILWKKEAEKREVKNYEKLIERIFPYVRFSEDEKMVKLTRCTHAFNYHHIEIIDSNLGMSIADSTNGFVSSPEESRKNVGEEAWFEHVKDLRER